MVARAAGDPVDWQGHAPRGSVWEATPAPATPPPLPCGHSAGLGQGTHGSSSSDNRDKCHHLQEGVRPSEASSGAKALKLERSPVAEDADDDDEPAMVLNDLCGWSNPRKMLYEVGTLSVPISDEESETQSNWAKKRAQGHTAVRGGVRIQPQAVWPQMRSGKGSLVQACPQGLSAWAGSWPLYFLGLGVLLRDRSTSEALSASSLLCREPGGSPFRLPCSQAPS